MHSRTVERLLIALGAGLAFGPASQAAANADTARLTLGEPRLHVLYVNTGKLSDDLLHGNGPRATWNLTIGGGELAGPADDALAIVPITAAKDGNGDGQVFSDVPIVIRARGERGKIVAQRSIGSVLTDSEGYAHLALWLPDVTCQGPLTIEAVMGGQRVSGQFDFRCGE